MSELERALDEVRGAEPPAGARERTRRAALATIERRERGARAGWLALPVVAAAAALLAWYAWPSAAPTDGSIVAARGVTLDGEPLEEGDAIGPGLLRIARGGHATLRLGRGHVEAGEGTALRIDDGVLHLESGAVEIDSGSGAALVAKGGECAATVAGRARLSLAASWLDVTIIAGTVETRPPATTCRVLDLQPELAATDHGHGTEPSVRSVSRDRSTPERADGHGTEPSVRSVSPPPRSQRDLLSEQVEAYRAAVALRGVDDAEQLRRLRAIQRRWPRWDLSHEVDFAVLETLVRLGRHDEVRREAERFLARNPRSPRAEEVRRLLTTE